MILSDPGDVLPVRSRASWTSSMGALGEKGMGRVSSDGVQGSEMSSSAVLRSRVACRRASALPI